MPFGRFLLTRLRARRPLTGVSPAFEIIEMDSDHAQPTLYPACPRAVAVDGQSREERVIHESQWHI